MMSELYCNYCGMAKGDRISCCQENHWMTNQEYRDYHGGEAPEDGSDEAEYYDELNSVYQQDRK